MNLTVVNLKIGDGRVGYLAWVLNALSGEVALPYPNGYSVDLLCSLCLG